MPTIMDTSPLDKA